MDSRKLKIRDLWSKGPAEAVIVLGGIYERSSWVAESVVQNDHESITTVSALAAAMKSIVNDATEQQKMALLRSQPDLAQSMESPEQLTADSQQEQAASVLHSMTKEEQVRFLKLNSEYKARFGFSFILSFGCSTKYTVLSALAGRIGNTRDKEIAIALEQVHKIAWTRILSKLESDQLAGFLTCHVLDTANGCPAVGMRITLSRVVTCDSGEGASVLISNFVTNDDGRLEDGPALKGAAFAVGVYEWVFHAGDYFVSKGTFVSATPFLDRIPVRFGIDNPDDHYHVPLLVSPWSYSTYRGS
eukprot:TRINITY_DN29280_c0_g1_i2.p1 TRINITY_DN29280_c0_g1~~TRINITY_DN29280_c0_g1_i2.p1  ORF type:complete len:302 (-),score=27.91 TRINITY_DN29280_c0_g1_i2:105-1010(-)